MIDRDRTLAKLDELDGYLAELRSVVPATFDEYRAVEKRRSCSRSSETPDASLCQRASQDARWYRDVTRRVYRI